MRGLRKIEFGAPVTFFVGENGSGKSTLLEALAVAAEAVALGAADLETDPTLAAARTLAANLTLSLGTPRPVTRLFVRAEDVFGFVKRVSEEMHGLRELESGYLAEGPPPRGSGLERAVGSVAGQLAKRAGARVVGIAGGAEKSLFVQETLGFDDCIDHRSLDLRRELAASCPNGIDGYFENVGGAVQAAVFDLLNPFARVAMCGMVSQYNEAEFPPGPNLGFVVGKRILIQGFIVSDKPEKVVEWQTLAAPWVADGSLAYREDVHDGLEEATKRLRIDKTAPSSTHIILRSKLFLLIIGRFFPN